MLDAQQVIDDLEAVGARRVVDAADVDQHLETATRIVAQEGQSLDHAVARHRHVELTVRQAGATHRPWQGVRDVFAKVPASCR
jgi:hypothetical protein